MRKRTALVIAGVVAGVIVTATITALLQNYFHNKKLETLTSQIATLNATLGSVGEITTCYTVQVKTYPGQEITEDLLIEQSIPASFTNETFASKSEVIGMFSKVSVSPGTPLTKDMVMTEEVIDSLREIDITGNRWPIGLREGDYVDLRITYPRGEDFIVLSHKRVNSITDQTLKVHLTEEEQILYQSALVDFYLSRNYGSDMYLTKYVEPGIQGAASTFYSVPTRIATVVKQDPNIIDMAQVSVQQNLRSTIDAARANFPEGDDSGGNIKSGRDELNTKVNSDFGLYETEKEQEDKESGEFDDSRSGSLVTDIGEGVE